MAQSARRTLVRAAVRIHQQLTRYRPESLPELPTAAWQRCQRLRELAYLTGAHHWPRAAEACRQQLRWTLQDVRRQLDALAIELDRNTLLAIASPREIFDDLATLESEFAALRINLRERTIAAVTEPIELEGVYLGRFEIVLPWENLAARHQPYTVAALDPRPASANGDVTHPHVQDEQLCEGEGTSAVRRALAAGRILDFFTIVAQILATYNPSSAYVRLEDWCGTSCSDCGDSVGEDDYRSCERCGSDVCDDCSVCCDSCDRCCCGGCAGMCTGCDQSACHSCLAHCSECQRKFCGGCLDDQSCEDCRNAREREPAAVDVTDDSADALRVG